MKTLKRLLAHLLALLLLFSCAACSSEESDSKGSGSKSKKKSKKSEESSDSADEDTGSSASDDLVLYLSDTAVFLGETKTVTVTVYGSGKERGAVTVKDRDGTVFCELETDGSGVYSTELEITGDEAGIHPLSAYCGSRQSREVNLYIQPEITAEMQTKLLSVLDELGAYVDGQFAEEPYSEEALSAVLAYLQARDDVDKAVINNGTVLFSTLDGLVGGYGCDSCEHDEAGSGEAITGSAVLSGFGGGGPQGTPKGSNDLIRWNDEIPENMVPAKDDMGFSNALDLFMMYKTNQDVAPYYVQSFDAETSSRWKVVTFDPDDSTMGNMNVNATIFLKDASVYTDAQVENITFTDAQTAVRDGIMPF